MRGVKACALNLRLSASSVWLRRSARRKRLSQVLDGDVALGQGDTIVLPASVHDLRNRHAEDATFVYTSFPLSR